MQERIRIPDDKMDYYKDMAEMYVGDDVSPDFYGWVFPKYDHVAVGQSLLDPPCYYFEGPLNLILSAAWPNSKESLTS